MATCNVEFGGAALPCDAYHHFYHYQSSAQYLWLAETLTALGQNEEAVAAYVRAVFQDHFNQEALDGKAGTRNIHASAPVYNKHSLLDAEFCASVGLENSPATTFHDKAVMFLQAGNAAQAIEEVNAAIAIDPVHSNSYFARGKCYFAQKEYALAHGDFMEAIRLSHIAHDVYHRYASHEHFMRARDYLKRHELDLAINDCTKSLDLYRGNKEALALRAQAYRAKGNVKLAEEDESKAVL
jgi:tetratricopeptide (TPR) repeat protein